MRKLLVIASLITVTAVFSGLLFGPEAAAGVGADASTSLTAAASQASFARFEAGGLLFLLVASAGAVGLAIRGSGRAVHRTAP